MNGIFSFGALALSTLPRDTFLKPSACRTIAAGVSAPAQSEGFRGLGEIANTPVFWSRRLQSGDIPRQLSIAFWGVEEGISSKTLTIIVVGNVNTGRDSRAGEGQDFEGGEVWAQELVLLEILAPRQQRNEGRGSLHQGPECAGPLDPIWILGRMLK